MNDLCWHWNLTTPTGDCRCVFPLQRFLYCIRNIQYQCEFEQDCVASSLAVSSSQDDHNWYHARRSDGKVGMIPGNYVKERGQDNGKDVSAPKTPLKVAVRTVDVPDQDETLTVKPTKRGEVELTDMQVWARPSKQNVSKSASVASDPVVVFWPLESIPRYSRTLTVQRYIMVTTNCCSVGVWRLIWTKHVSTVLPFVCMCVCVLRQFGHKWFYSTECCPVLSLENLFKAFTVSSKSLFTIFIFTWPYTMYKHKQEHAVRWKFKNCTQHKK